MLETFLWSGSVVFKSDESCVIAALDPDWDILQHFETPGSVFGFALDGWGTVLQHRGRRHALGPGCYFVVPSGGGELTSPGGRILLINAHGANVPFMVGGPIEPTGRLRYIDGCTDSLLIHPWRLGEPCMNHLHIPAGTSQTMHTHPSDRIGVVVRGRGRCVTPDGVTALAPGMLWRIPAEGQHCFHTDDIALDVIAWHPDSDFGPTDDSHPMLNRTIVDGVSAANIPEIRTV